jgi:DNA-directed RNA polymerase subunit K/omega
MVHRPDEMNAFEFVVVASLRAAQLMRGCTPRISTREKTITTAQLEVAGGKVARLRPVPILGAQADAQDVAATAMLT